MPDFNVRSDSVNVERIMEQIRGRIREKRGVDYTEEQIRELAAVKIEKLLDPRGIRSDLLEQFRKAQPAYEPPELPNFAFEATTLFESHRAPIRWIRMLLRPILKLLFNPNPLIQALHIQSQLNTTNAEREAKREAARRAMDQLYYELIHNLVVEATRLGIEIKNLKMRAESLTSRLEFNERRARALESVVVYRPSEERDVPAVSGERPGSQFQPPAVQTSALPASSRQGPSALRDPQGRPEPGRGTASPGQPPSTGQGADGPGQRSRRRRRRRGRRGGGPAASLMGHAGSDQTDSHPPAATPVDTGRAEAVETPTDSGPADPDEQ